MREPLVDRRSRCTPWLLGGIVAVAVVLRLWGLSQGGALLNGRPDEREMLERTVAFSAGDFNPRWFVYPNLFFWVSWAWIEGVLAFVRLVQPVPDYVTLVGTDLPRLVLIGRVLPALVGAATVAVLFGFARSFGGARLGLVAAALLATNFLHVRDSHALKTESFLALGTLCAVGLLARWAEGRTPSRLLAAGVAIGVTTGFKYNGILLLSAAGLADLWSSPHTGLRRLLPTPALFGMGGIVALTFLCCSPYLVLDWGRTRDTVALVQGAIFASRPAPVPVHETRVQAVRRNLAARAFGYHVRVSLRRGAGLAFAALTPVALLMGLRPGQGPLLMLSTAVCVVYFLVAGSSPVHLARYFTPIVPLLCLLIAALLVELSRRMPGRRPLWVGLFTLVVVAEPLSHAVAYDRLAARTDTRVLATRWMAENLSRDAVVAQLGTLVFPLADPELPEGIRRADLALGATDFQRAGVTHVVTHEHLLPFSRLIAPQMAAIGPALRLLAAWTPYAADPGGGFEPEDAYYIPFWDFERIVRPGPLVKIYAWSLPTSASP